MCVRHNAGIYKADIGIKGGVIVGIGKAGNPAVMHGVTPGMVCGVNTEAIAAEGLILTAGGFDAHVHFICPQICDEAIASGAATLCMSLCVRGSADKTPQGSRHCLAAERGLPVEPEPPHARQAPTTSNSCSWRLMTFR